MGSLIGWVSAIATWFITSGIFALLDRSFSLSDRVSWLSILFIGIPLALGWLAYYLAPSILLTLFERMLHILFNIFSALTSLFKQGKKSEDLARQPFKDKKTTDLAPPPFKENRLKYHFVCFPDVLNGIPMVYYYPNNLILDLNVPLFDRLVDEECFEVEAIADAAGGAEIRKDGQILGRIQKYGSMISDWQRREEPMLCKITNIREGNEAVGLGFYRNEESKLTDCKIEVARLTKNRSEDMQISVSCMSDGAHLNIAPECIDESGSIPVLHITNGEVGCLPKKFNKIHDDYGIRGVFVDHVEEDESEKFVAYVRIYWQS